MIMSATVPVILVRYDTVYIEQGFPSPAIGIFKQHGKGLSFQMQEGKCNNYYGNIVQVVDTLMEVLRSDALSDSIFVNTIASVECHFL